MSRKKPCTSCDLIALTGKGEEVPLNDPRSTGVAYREPPKHGGRCKAEWTPLPSGPSLLDALDAERRKLEGA